MGFKSALQQFVLKPAKHKLGKQKTIIVDFSNLNNIHHSLTNGIWKSMRSSITAIKRLETEKKSLCRIDHW